MLLRRLAHLHTKRLRRLLHHDTGQWQKTFTKSVRQKLEDYWKHRVNQLSLVRNTTQSDAEKYYVLSMFPYPSGKLHMGHVRVYSISDVMARYHRLCGRLVVHPMGWDAFGLPAENAAIEHGEKPRLWTIRNIQAMKKQFEDLCCSFDWSSEFSTCDPDYYKWTQFIFLKMFDAGLVYQKQGAVNWDPVDQTVLADEQIDEEGKSWRSGVKVERRFFKQWYIRTTAYSKSLIEGLSEVDSDLWKDIIDLQRNWIGECDGVRLTFDLQTDSGEKLEPLSVFTRHPGCVPGSSHILVSPDHYLSHKDYYSTDTSLPLKAEGVERLSVQATNPFTGQSLPVILCHQWPHKDTLDSHIGIPDLCEEAKRVADILDLPYTSVINKADDTLHNAGEFSGLSVEKSFDAAVSKAKELKCGGDITSSSARDWLISRQRYWGTPIPVIHCPKYGVMPVPYSDLPVVLPDIPEFSGKGQTPLLQADDWLKVKCSRCDCGGYGRRETDTMDTFVDSSWYFLRYLDAHNTEQPFSRESANRYMPVDLYIGGKEHAIMHLYYARFITHFLFSEGLVPQREPFVNLLTQGMVMGRTYQVQDSGKYLKPQEIDLSGEAPTEKSTGLPLKCHWEKMSKSKYNGVDPQEVLEAFGSDSTRLAILSNVAPKSDRHWSNEVFQGVLRWQARVWSLVSAVVEHRQGELQSDTDLAEEWDESVRNTRNYFLHEVNHHLKKTFLLSVAISRLQGLTNALKKVPASVLVCCPQCQRALSDLVVMLAPFAPLFASELWQGLHSHRSDSQTSTHDSIWEQNWPVVDEDYRLCLKVKIDNKEAFQVPIPGEFDDAMKLTKTEAISLAQNHPGWSTVPKHKPVHSYSLFIEPGLRVELLLNTKSSKKHKKAKKQKATAAS